MAALSELLQPFCILVLYADDDRQPGVRIADVGVEEARVDRGWIGVEVAWLGIGAVQGSIGMSAS